VWYNMHYIRHMYSNRIKSFSIILRLTWSHDPAEWQSDDGERRAESVAGVVSSRMATATRRACSLMASRASWSLSRRQTGSDVTAPVLRLEPESGGF